MVDANFVAVSGSSNYGLRTVTILMAELSVPPTPSFAPNSLAIGSRLDAHMAKVESILNEAGGALEGRSCGRCSSLFGHDRMSILASIHAAITTRRYARDVGFAVKIAISTAPCFIGRLSNARGGMIAIGEASDRAVLLLAKSRPNVIVCDCLTWRHAGLAMERDQLSPRDAEIECYEVDDTFVYNAFQQRDLEKASVSVVRIYRQGDFWTIVDNNSEMHFRDSKGFRCLDRLLSAPYVEVHALELAALSASEKLADLLPVSVHATKPQVILDSKAKSEYRARLKELDAEIQEAQRCSDSARVTRATEEKSAFLRELTSALGFHGRDRQFSSAGDRARVNITRTIRAAIQRITEADRRLGRRLQAEVKTGAFCSYRPISIDAFRLCNFSK